MSGKWRLVILAAAGGAAIAATVAYAAIPGSNGTIAACYHNVTGALRVVDAETGARCGRSSRSLTWNVQGPAGPAGPQGAAGPAGPPGTAFTEFKRRVAETPFDSSERKGLIVECPDGWIALTGGAYTLMEAGASRPLALLNSAPLSFATEQPYGWLAEGRETEPYSGDWKLRVEVICVQP